MDDLRRGVPFRRGGVLIIIWFVEVVGVCKLKKVLFHFARLEYILRHLLLLNNLTGHFLPRKLFLDLVLCEVHGGLVLAPLRAISCLYAPVVWLLL